MVSQLPFFNKSLVTNLVAILFAVTGYFLPAPFRDPFFNIGLFAFLRSPHKLASHPHAI
jgi:hypothetical protein